MSPRFLEGSSLFGVLDFSMMNVRSYAQYGQMWSITKRCIENVFDGPFGSVPIMWLLQRVPKTR